jgi:hypothetical protein
MRNIAELNGKPCPVIKAFVAAARARLSLENEIVYADANDRLAEISQDLANSSYARGMTAQRLRAFYCVEILHHWLFSLKEQYPIEALTGRAERTYAGLTQLLGELEEFEKGATALRTDYRFRRSQLLGSDELRLARLPEIVMVVKQLKDMVFILRSRLTRDTPLGTVGKLLGDTLFMTKKGYYEYTHHAHDLLNISEENGITPWT